jgi:hypothetical protein
LKAHSARPGFLTEFDRDGPLYEKNGVKVIAFEVDHGDEEMIADV